MSKYIDVDLLKKEIEKRFWSYGTPLHDDEVTTKVDEILSFIDSLPDEPVSNDLEEAAKTFCDTLEGKEAWSYGPDHYDWDDVNNAFIAGAEWQKEQMLKDAVDLDADIEKELRLHYNDDQDVYWWNYLKNSFRHFYELGLNARKEE